MLSEVEAIVRRQLAEHSVEQLDDGYIINSGVGTSRLELLRASPNQGDPEVVSIAEITTQFAPNAPPRFDLADIGRLNAMAVHGAYFLSDDVIGMKAQYSIYAHEPAPELAAKAILDTFAGQMALGFSVLAGSLSEERLIRERSFQECPRRWDPPPEPASFSSAAEFFRGRGFVSTSSDTGLSLEAVLSGESPSAMMNAEADTALIHVETNVPHPIAGVGYLATIALPVDLPRSVAPQVCHQLNVLEAQQLDFVPRLGAWGLRGVGEQLVYSQFWPNSQPFGEVHRTLMWWMILRVRWLKTHYWYPSMGIALQELKIEQP